jgi:hypothetical protein
VVTPAVPDVSPEIDTMTFSADEVEFTGNIDISGNLNVGSLSIGGVGINANLNVVQYGRYFDVVLAGQGGGGGINWTLASPDETFVSEQYHAEIVDNGTTNALGQQYFLRFKSTGMYRLQLAWTITRDYSTGTALASFFPTPPGYPTIPGLPGEPPVPDYPSPYIPDPLVPLPNFGGGGGSSSSIVTTAQWNAAEFFVHLCNEYDNESTLATTFPEFEAIQGQTFTGYEASNFSNLTTQISFPPAEGQRFYFKGLTSATSGERINRLFVDITFSLTATSPKDMFFYIFGHVPGNTTDPFYFNVNNLTYTITRLA